MIDLFCLGEPLMEFNQQPDGRYLKGFGGDVSNCAVAAARSGANAGMLANIGTDSFGSDFLDLWQDEGISTEFVKRFEDAPTGVYFVTHGKDGHQFDYYRAGSAASQMTAKDLPQSALAQTRMLHVSAISQAISKTASDSVIAAITAVKAGGGMVSYDTNLRLRLWPLSEAKAVIRNAVGLADVVLPGLDDAILLTGLEAPDEIADFFLELGSNIVALTMGAQGVLIATPQKRQTIPGHQVKAIDATGAGDTFDGAFLARLLAGDDPFQAGLYANAAAALAVQSFGAITAIPTLSQIQQHMQKNPIDLN